MSVILKKDTWKIKDPNTGEYRDSTVFASTFAEDTADIVAEATAAIDAQETRAAGIVSDAQADIDTIAASVQSMTQTGTDTTLTVSGAAADAAVVGDEVTELKTAIKLIDGVSEINFVKDYYIVTSGSTVNINSPQPSQNGFKYAVVDCKENDWFTVTSSGGQNPRAWCFIDASGNSLSVATASTAYNNFVIKAPANAAKLVINAKNDEVSFVGITTELPTGGRYLFNAVSNITLDMLEKGGYVTYNKDDYREAMRARTNNWYYALNDINVFIKKATYPNALASLQLYNNQRISTSSSTWAASQLIPKGSVFALSLTSSNSGNVSKTVEEIYDMFHFVNCEKTVSVDFNPDYWVVVKGGFSSTNNQLYDSNDNAIAILNYFKTDDSFVQIVCEDGYSVDVIGYDKGFNIIKTATQFGGDLTGTHFIDTSGCCYCRFFVKGSAGITTADISNVTITQNKPLSVESFRDGTILCIAKDGINDDDLSYAPVYPKSSIVSFQKAFDQGFRGTNLHLQKTSDGEFVVFHNKTINDYARNSDGTAISGTVTVTTSTLATLDQYDFGIYFGSQYAGLKITRFEEALAFCKKRGMYVFIEPVTTLESSDIEDVCGLLNKYGMGDKCGYFAYYPDSLEAVHEILPLADLGYAVPSDTDEAYFLARLNRLIALKESNDVYMWFSPTKFSTSTHEAIEAAGLKYFVSIANDIEPDNIVAMVESRPQVGGIQTQVVPAYSALQKTAL